MTYWWFAWHYFLFRRESACSNCIVGLSSFADGKDAIVLMFLRTNICCDCWVRVRFCWDVSLLHILPYVKQLNCETWIEDFAINVLIKLLLFSGDPMSCLQYCFSCCFVCKAIYWVFLLYKDNNLAVRVEENTLVVLYFLVDWSVQGS